jgi:hypothetical protein
MRKKSVEITCDYLPTGLNRPTPPPAFGERTSILVGPTSRRRRADSWALFYAHQDEEPPNGATAKSSNG